MPLGAKALAPDIGGVPECGGGITEDRMELDCEIGALVLEQQCCILRGRVAVGDRRQRFDIDFDQPQCILGNPGGIGEHEGEHLADVAHLGLGDHRLPERFEIRQRLQPHGNARHAVADILRGEHAMHAGKRAGGGNVDRADAAMGDGAAQERRVQHVLACEIVDILPAATEKAEIFEAFDRAADERVDRSHLCSRARSPASSLWP